MRVLGEVVRLTVGADVLDLPGTPGNRLAPVYSGLPADGVAALGVAALTGRVASIPELGSRVEIGDVRTGAGVAARGVCPTRTPPVCVAAAAGGIVRVVGLGLVVVLGVNTLARLGGTTELRILVRLESLAPRMPGYVVARLDGTTVLVIVGRLTGAVVVRGLRARGDTAAGWRVRGEGDTVVGEGRVAVLAAGRVLCSAGVPACILRLGPGSDGLMGAVRVTVLAAGRGARTGGVTVRTVGALTGAGAALLAGAGF